jgi:hypothetical protein
MNSNFTLDLLPRESVVSRSRANSVRLGTKTVKVTPVFHAYWRFAAERQRIFHRRLHGEDGNQLTEDPVLARFRFTNAYRASDRVSQYLIRNVIYRHDLPNDSTNLFYRIMLFKLFNKIETWEYLERELGPPTWADFNFRRLDNALSRRMLSGEPIYSAAYIMPSGTSAFGCKLKHQNHLRLIEQLVRQKYAERMSECTSMSQAFDLLLLAPSIGPFLAYQFVTDLNYSSLTEFTEHEFVVAGPGALDGIDKCFEKADDHESADIIRYMYEHQEQHFAEQDLAFLDLWGRPLQLIDCQNIFCEISKYARVAFPEYLGVAGRTRIKQKFSSNGHLPSPWYPPSWGLNGKIEQRQAKSGR